MTKIKGEDNDDNQVLQGTLFLEANVVEFPDNTYNRTTSYRQLDPLSKEELDDIDLEELKAAIAKRLAQIKINL